MNNHIDIKRLDAPVLEPDYTRLVIRPFELPKKRVAEVVARVAALDDSCVQEELRQVLSEFSADHAKLPEVFEKNYAWAESRSGDPPGGRPLSPAGRLLAGAYFTSEYAFEATALFNPSIAAAPDTGVSHPLGDLRFIMSARSVGEGHVSSVSFRTGFIDKDGGVSIDPEGRAAVTGERRSLAVSDAARSAAAGSADNSLPYETRFDPATPLSERLLFPSAAAEQNGIEDARFVRFTDEDGSVTYYATYTAYDGKNIRPCLIETPDFLSFTMRALSGAMALNKGMALFPRKIKRQGRGRYAMLSRIDGESLYLMFSDDMVTWNEGAKIASPLFPWEFIQIGNCGSPLELPPSTGQAGWLVLTHGVGSLRRYSIGALLLDAADPARVTGRLAAPLISPGERERAGYVPNVIYTCGSIIHGEHLIIPYGSADRSIAFISIKTAELLEKLTGGQSPYAYT
ncbi:MAG: glycoside hydrolase family 130 protein [Treponema sp.]|jgi:predicted GH43/DUF377 family glycosyl hydrolase|nr:glycoside hydrolase family 130 protein [Treponema sp.]